MTDCTSYLPGHNVHPGQANHRGELIATGQVDAVRTSGRITIKADTGHHHVWNHTPADVAAVGGRPVDLWSSGLLRIRLDADRWRLFNVAFDRETFEPMLGDHVSSGAGELLKLRLGANSTLDRAEAKRQYEECQLEAGQ
jgi:hypothetical protein